MERRSKNTRNVVKKSVFDLFESRQIYVKVSEKADEEGKAKYQQYIKINMENVQK